MMTDDQTTMIRSFLKAGSGMAADMICDCFWSSFDTPNQAAEALDCFIRKPTFPIPASDTMHLARLRDHIGEVAKEARNHGEIQERT